MSITELIPNQIIISMATILFVGTCCAIVMIELSIAMFAVNVAHMVDRILPVKETGKASNSAEVGNKKQFLDRLMFWEKTNQPSLPDTIR
jgi:hypothetical protein